MTMADDNVDNQEDSGSTFGEVAKREFTTEDGGEPVLVEDKIKSEESVEETKSTDEPEGEVSLDGAVKTEESSNTEESKLTEKGTKLDPNPQSAVHQELANERKIRSDYERVLGSPELLVEFAKSQYGIDIPTKKQTEQTTDAPTDTLVKEYKPEDFESLEDVASVVNGLQKSFAEARKLDAEQIQQLKETVQSLQTSERTSQDIDSLRTLPELTPSNPEFIEGLEEEIAQEYHRLDFDEKTKMYKGKHSIADIGKKFISIAKTARKAGSLKAQTVVKDKSQGKVTTSPKVADEVNTDDLSPEDSIALGISKMKFR